MDDLYRERMARTVGILTEDELERVRTTPVAVAGLGMGGSIFINLVRMGFERFHIADPDIYERTNINRQRLAKESTIRRRKDDSLLEEAQDINPAIEVELFRDGVQADNVDRFLDGIACVVDVVDVFAMEAKVALNERAHELGIPVVSSGCLGFGAVVMVYDPTGPSFAQLSGISPDKSNSENLRLFVRLMTSEVPDYMAEQMQRAVDGQGHLPFVVAGVEFAGAIVVTEVTKHVLGIGDRPVAPTGIFCEPLTLRLETFMSPAAADLQSA